MSNQKVPILNLAAQYELVGEELETSILSVLRSGEYVLGKNVASLEEKVAELCQCEHGVAVANGTDALMLSLWALDVSEGDEVITTPFTFAATAEAIVLRGAKPVFVDIDPATFNIDPNKVEAAITSKTRAIMPVHLYGLASDMAAIMDIASGAGIDVIEDNAQAIGATYNGQRTGSFGRTSCISFYPTKNLGACGDAGMIVTRDEKVAHRLRALRAHGSHRRYYHDELGVNSRLDEIQAAALLVKLNHLESWNNRRNQIAARYNERLAGLPGITLPVAYSASSDRTHVWHQYTIRVHQSARHSSPQATLSNPEREDLVARLTNAGIGSMCYYPVPLHMQKPFRMDYRDGDFPESERAALEVLSLPLYPELTDEQVDLVADRVAQAVGERNALFAPVQQVGSPMVPAF